LPTLPEYRVTESANIILSIIDSARLRLRRLNVAVAGGLALTVAGASFLLTMPLIRHGGIEGAWGVIMAIVKVVAIIGILYAVGRWFVLGVFFGLDRRKAALKIERELPGLGNDLVVSLDLIEAPSGTWNLYSAALAGAHINAAAGRLTGLDVSPALPYRRFRRVIGSAAAIVAAAVLMAILWPTPARQAAAYLLSADLLPGTATLRKIEQSLPLGDFEILYEYPAYTGWEKRSVSAADGSLRAIKGTVATIRARSQQALQNARIQMEKSVIPATLVDSRKIEVRITMMQVGHYRIVAEGKNGGNFVESAAHPIEIIQDSSPEVEMVSPTADQEVEDAGVLPLQFSAKDDFGLKEISVVYSLNGKETRVSIISPEPGRREVSGAYTWDLSKLDLRPGDEVRYYLEVLDNDAVSGPKKGVSRALKISIFSPRKEHNRLVDLQWQLFDRMVAVLGADLVRKPLGQGAPASNPLAPDQAIAEGLDDLLHRIDEIVTGLKKDRLGDLNTLTLLTNVKSELQTLAVHRKELLAQQKPPEAALARRQAAEIPVLETQIIALDNEIERQKVSEVTRRGDELLETQRGISDLLKRAKAGDKAALAKLEKEVAHLQEIMQQMMEALSRSKGELPDDFVNSDALKNMPIERSADVFEKMREAIKNGDLDSAMQMAQNLQDTFAKMNSALQSGGKSFGDSRMGQSLQQLQDISQRATQLKERQQKLFDESQKIGVHEQQELLARQEAERKDALSKIKKKLEELRKVTTKTHDSLMGINPDEPKTDARLAAFVRNIGQALKNMLNAHLTRAEQQLGAEDLFGLLSTMRMTQQEAQQVQRESQAMMSLNPQNSKAADEVVKGADRMVKLINEIIDMLEKTMQPKERRFSEEEQNRLNDMTHEQEQLQQEAEQLRSDMEGLRKKFPMMGEEHEKKIGNAAGAMGNAGSRLKARDPNGALPHEALAIQNLSEVGESLKQLMQQMREGAMGMPIPIPMPGGGSSGGRMEGGYQMPGSFCPGKVEIPGRETYKVPEEYRGDILRAMQHEAPEIYRRLNLDYYKKLIQ